MPNNRLIPAGTPNDGLPPNWKPIDEPPVVVGGGTPPPAGPPGPGPFFAASIPTNFGLQPDIMPTRYPGGLSAYRVMPPAASGVAQSNAAAKSIVVQNNSSVVDQITQQIVEGANYQTVLANGSPATARPNLNFEPPITVTDDSANSSTDIAVPVFVGSGASHATGLVPDPGSSAGTTRYLREDGTFQVPPGTGGAAFYQTVQLAGTSKPQETRLNFLAPFSVTDNAGNTSSDVNIACFAAKGLTLISGAAISTSAVNLGSVSITMPATGGPYSVDLRYFLYLHFTSSVQWVNFWVQANVADSTGQTVYAGTGTANSNGAAGGNTSANCSWISDGNWAAGTAVTFTLWGQASASGPNVVAAPGVGSGPSSTFQAVAVPSV